MSMRRGLPDSVRSRHESHYVESLGIPLPEPIGMRIKISEIKPNSDQPRSVLGDLSGLKRSIQTKGIIEPIVVRKLGDFYQIISGERRFMAAREIGLDEIPCIVREADDAETLEVALIENLQRKDLTPFEESDGLRQLVEKHGFTHEEIAERIGKSRSSISESLSLTRIPEDIRQLCEKHGIQAKSMLLQIARQDSASDMLNLTQNIIRHGISREQARSYRPEFATARSKPFTFRHRAPDKSFTVIVKFNKSDVSDEEVQEALMQALQKIEKDDAGVGTPTAQPAL